MKINIDAKRGAEAVTGFLQKTSDLGKKTIEDVQAGAIALSAKTKQDGYLRRLKKYNPLFPDVFYSDEFNMPNMIMIRDDAERRGIDVCEGAIGWLGKESGMEVLYLYDEAVADSGINFVPAASCDAVYYVDSFDRNRYIRVDCIFGKAHEERLAELEYVANCLGARSCTIEINETSTELSVAKKKSTAEGGTTIRGVKSSSSENVEQNAMLKASTTRSGTITVEFAGSNDPREPDLKWFKHDETIKRLVEMRCNGSNQVKSKTLRLSGA